MRASRIPLYEAIQAKRQSTLLVYCTSDREGAQTQIGQDILSPLVNHLDKIGDVGRISLFLYTRGGDTLAAWSAVNLIRNFCNDFEVIAPFNCHSAGTLMALGANRIIMTKQATLGPIDPSVNGPLNPTAVPNNYNSRVPVNVEFVNSFFEMAKSELQINDQEHLSKIFQILAQHIHPLTLGQVYRSRSQIKMLANKMLHFHEVEPEKKDEIINFLCSESGSHDYTMHRKEAKNLGLNIETPDDELYQIIKSIYTDIENEMELRKPFKPNMMLNTTQQTPAGNQRPYTLRRCIIESIQGGTDVVISEGYVSMQQVTMPGQGQQVLPITQQIINDTRTFEGWRHED